MASVFSIDPKVIRRLDKLVEKCPKAYKLVREEDWCGNTAKYYTMPAELISFRQPSAKRELTDEQRQARSDRLKAAREKRLGKYTGE